MSYSELEKMGYIHKIQRAVVKEEEEIFPNVHRIASLLKRWLLGTHQSSQNKNKAITLMNMYSDTIEEPQIVEGFYL